MAARGRTMDFFERQEVARRKTGLLVFYFTIAVVLMILALYVVALCALWIIQGVPSDEEAWIHLNEEFTNSWFEPRIFLVVCAAMLGIIALGSTYKTFELRQGGERLANAARRPSTPPGHTRLRRTSLVERRGGDGHRRRNCGTACVSDAG